MTEVLDRPKYPTAIPSSTSIPNVSCSRLSPSAGDPPEQAPLVGHGSRALLDVAIANRPMLVNMARGFVGCTSRAEDVVHDVSIKLIDFPKQDDVRQPAAYVARMVRNASIDACRYQSLENTYHADEEDGLDVPSPACTPEALAARSCAR